MFWRSFPHFLTNIICGFVPNTARRKKVRTILNSPFVSELNFARRTVPGRVRSVRTAVGFMARSLIIIINKQWVFKFPLKRDNYRELALREKRLVDALAPYSPVHVPPVELLYHGRKIVRMYEFVQGKNIRDFSPERILAHRMELARQIAQFMFDIGRVDPPEIRDLKPTPDARPGYAYGWFQGDICDNFMVDANTMKIIAFIDWEDCEFCDFSSAFTREPKTPQRELMAAVKTEYDRLYAQLKK